jgi:NADH dehydrogenase
MTPRTVCLLGGGGFVGSRLAALLTRRGWRVCVPTRRREAVKHLLVLPGIDVVEADIHDPAALVRLFAGVDAVINLTGILHEYRRGEFQRVHAQLPAKVADACQVAGVRRLVHMSALGAAADSRSAYQRSKAAGEAAVRAAPGLEITIFRPSVVFGPGDSFLTMFAALLRLAPVVPLADGHARFQPVFVGDVAQAFADALDDPATVGRTYDLGGPRVYTLADLMRLTAKALGLCRVVIPLGPGPSGLFARLMELKPGRKLMTRDNHYAMLTDNVLPAGVDPQPTSLENALGYLREHSPRQAYHGFRGKARR